MLSDEGRAQQPTLQGADTVQVGNSAVRAGSATPPLSRWNSYREGWTILSRGHVNVLLVFVPAGIVSGALGLPAEVVFWLNFLAVVPLALLITMAVLRLSAEAGPVRGGLLRAILGNTVEMIVSTLYHAAFFRPVCRFLTSWPRQRFASSPWPRARFNLSSGS
jgi:hypothetical protein